MSKHFNFIFFVIIIFLLTSCHNTDSIITVSRHIEAITTKPQLSKTQIIKENNIPVIPERKADKLSWYLALWEVYRSPGHLILQKEKSIREKMLYRYMSQGYSKEKTIALTFDDGPHSNYTPQLLQILNKYNVKATFFVVGDMAEKYPDLIKDLARSGQLIANHTYHHVRLTTISEIEARVEWQACNNVIKSITGKTMKFCRPPGGDYDHIVTDSAMSLGLTTVLWTTNSGDYEEPGSRTIYNKIIYRISPGGIVLMHDGVQETIDILPELIEHLQSEGYKFKTIEEMILDTANYK